MIGATNAARGAIILLTRGAQLRSGRSSPIYFVNTCQEAVATIVRERMRLQAQKTGKMPKLR
jgi:hypothetical protein